MNNVESAGFPTYEKITFSWFINTLCQYRCDYCCAADLLTKKDVPEIHTIYKDILKRLKIIVNLQKLNGYVLEFLGGEPTLHPHFIEIVDSCLELKGWSQLIVNTNFAKSESYWHNFNHEKYKDFEISVSVHPQYLNDKVEQFITKFNNIYKLPHTKITMCMSILDDDRYIDFYRRVIRYCEDNNVQYALNYINSTKYFESNFRDDFFKKIDIGDVAPTAGHLKVPYTIDGEKYILDTQEIEKRKLDSFKGYNCVPKLWRIDPRGEFYNGCTGEPVNHIGSNIRNCVTCPKERCGCEELLNYHKTPPGAEPPTS